MARARVDLPMAAVQLRRLFSAQLAPRRSGCLGLGIEFDSTGSGVSPSFFGMAAEGGIASEGIEFMRALEAEAAARIKPLPMNIDGALAAVLYDLGFPPAADHVCCS